MPSIKRSCSCRVQRPRDCFLGRFGDCSESGVQAAALGAKSAVLVLAMGLNFDIEDEE